MRILVFLASPLRLGDPGLDPVDGRLLDAVVAVMGGSLAIVAGRYAAAHLDQLGAVFSMRCGARGGTGHAAGVLGVKNDEVPAPEAARVEIGDGTHRRAMDETRHP